MKEYKGEGNRKKGNGDGTGDRRNERRREKREGRRRWLRGNEKDSVGEDVR